jgi:hypothetical protein
MRDKMSQDKLTPYQVGALAEFLTFPEVRVNFPNAQLGVEYCRGYIRMGSFDAKTGFVKSVLEMGPYVEMTPEQALSALRQELNTAFKPEFVPNIAIVVNGKVVEKGKPHQKDWGKPTQYHLTEHSPYSMILRRDGWHGQDVGVADVRVYGADIMTTPAIDAGSLTDKIRAPELGHAIEEYLGITEGKNAEVGNRDLYVAGRFRLSEDSGFGGACIEFVADNIDVFVRRQPDKHLYIASLNPALKGRITPDLAKTVERLARQKADRR